MSELLIDIAILKRILMLGIPMGLQQAITSLSNVVVTSYVNAFGSDSMAGWSAYLRIHNLVLMPIMSLSMAITSFVGQNYGARRYDRIRKGTRNILILGCACAIVCGGLIILLQKPSISLFNNDPGVIYYGCIFINMQLPLMWFASLCNLLAGSLRGMGLATSLPSSACFPLWSAGRFTWPAPRHFPTPFRWWPSPTRWAGSSVPCLWRCTTAVGLLAC